MKANAKTQHGTQPVSTMSFSAKIRHVFRRNGSKLFFFVVEKCVNRFKFTRI